MVTRALLVAISIAFIGISGTSQSQPDDACIRQQGEGRYETAISSCTQLIRSGNYSGKDLAGLFNNRGAAYFKLGELSVAKRDFDEAIRIYPELSSAHENRGQVHQANEDYDAAMKDFNEAIRINPKADIALNARGFLKLYRGDLSGALSDFDAAIKAAFLPHYGYYLDRGTAYHRLGNIDSAFEDFARAIDQEGRTTKSGWEYLIPSDPIFEQKFLARAKEYSSGDYKLICLDLAIHSNPNNLDNYLIRGYARVVSGFMDKAMEDFNFLVQKQPNNPVFLTYRAFGFTSGITIANRASRSNLARQDLDAALSAEVTFSPAYALRGYVNLQSGNYDDAIEDYTNAISTDPNYVRAFGNRAKALCQKGRKDEALSDFDVFLRQSPNDVRYYQKFLRKGGFHTDAIDGIYNDATRSALSSWVHSGTNCSTVLSLFTGPGPPTGY